MSFKFSAPVILSSLTFMFSGCIKPESSPENNAPVAAYTMQGNSLFASSSDSDGDTLTHTWKINGVVISNDPQLDLDSEYTIGNNVVSGTFDIELIASDGDKQSNIFIQNMVFELPNQAPVTSFDKNATSISATSTDENNDPLTFEWSVDGQIISLGTSIDLTQQYSINGVALEGAQTVTLTTSDGQLNSSVAIQNVVFSQLNHGPVASYEYQADVIVSTSTDADEDTLSYSWTVNGFELSTQDSLDLNGAYEFESFIVQGLHDVTLTVSDATVTNSIVIADAAFNYAPTAIIDSPELLTIDTTLTFDGSQSSDQDQNDTIDAYRWFVDGALINQDSALNTLEYAFSTLGEHTVSLEVEDNHGATSSVVSSVTIIDSDVTNNAPVASITTNATSGVAPASFVFDGSESADIEDGTNLTYQWSINSVIIDETADSLSYEFLTSGEYQIGLIVYDTTGLASPLTQSTITITDPQQNTQPIAMLQASATSAQSATDIIFTTIGSSDAEDSSVLTYKWFVDGVEVDQMVSDTFTFSSDTEGDFEISVVVSDTQGLASLAVRQIITITNVNATPVADFSSSATTAIAPATLTFDGSISSDTEDDNSELTFEWYIDDVLFDNTEQTSYDFTTQGDYTIKLVVTDTQNASSFITRTISITDSVANTLPVAQIDASSLVGLTPSSINFDGSNSSDAEDGANLTYVWTIDSIVVDDEITDSLVVEFTTPGTYQIGLVVTDTQGASSIVASETITITDPAQNTIPVAIISADANSALTPSTIVFDASTSSDSEDAMNLTYQWYLDDVLINGETGNSLSYEFTAAGTYVVSLIVLDTLNAPSLSVSETITITDPIVDTIPVAMFSAQTVDLLVSVDASLSSGDSITYAWDFNGEETGTGNTSFYSFTTPGEKIITLVVSDIDGDTDSYSQTVIVDEPIVNDSIIFEEDFEDYADNSQPSGWDIYANYQKNPTYNPSVYNTSINVVSNDSNSGSKSLKIEGDGSNPMQIVKVLNGTYDKIYTRVYVKQTLQMGGLTNTNHDHIIALRADSGSANKEVRFGEAKGAIGTTLVNNSPNYDDGAPDPQSPNFGEHVVTADVWHCIEVGFDDTGDVSKLFAWSDGVLVHSIEQNSDFTNIKNSVEDHWMSDMFNELAFGWHSFSSHSNTLHFDDLVIATDRIGCDDSLARVMLTPEFELTQDSMIVTADASASTGSSEFTYSWDFDGEYTTTGVNPSYTFATGGNKDITLTLISGSNTKSFTQSIDVIDTAYTDLLERVSSNIVAPTCLACHESSSSSTLTFNSSMPTDVESALSDYIANASAQGLIDVPNGTGHMSDPADQITDATNEQDWEDLVLIIEASANQGGSFPEHAFIADDFEGQDHNAKPLNWKTAVGYQVDAANNNSDSTSFVLIDSTMAFSGTNSVRVKTSNNVIHPAFLFQELPATYDAFYSRAWMYIPVQLGGGVKGPDGNHVHFMAYSGGMGGSNPPELRFGAAQDAILSAFLPTGIDAGTTNIKPTTIIPANEWVCVEFAAIKHDTFDQTKAWVNGEEVFAAIAPTDWATNPGQYLSNDAQITKLISFGWRAFGDTKDVEDVWFDDIAVSHEYIGCN